MALDLEAIPLVDGHCHSLLRQQPSGDVAFRRHLTESTLPGAVADVTSSLAYHAAIHELAELLDCAPTPEAVHAARASLGLEPLARRIYEGAAFRALLVDTGYGGPEVLSLAELQALAPAVDVREVLRLEPLIERLIVEADDFDGFLGAYRAALADLRGAGYVGLKSVIAYRTGLHLAPVGVREAAAAFVEVHQAARRAGRIRIASKPLLDFLVLAAVEEAARQEVPIQFHTGLGDPDLDLTLVDPAALRLVFADAYRGAPIVLLHTGYPYVRSMAYCAAMYPNVYADMGEVPLFVAADVGSVVRELLGLAPASKVLFSTDASLVPELYWLGARAGRRALGEVLAGQVAAGLLAERAAQELAELVLWRNAERVYRL